MSRGGRGKTEGKLRYCETNKRITEINKTESELVKTDSEEGEKRERGMADGRKILVEINGL